MGSFGFATLLVSRALKNGEPWIFGIARVRFRPVAAKKHRTFVRLDHQGVRTIVAEPAGRYGFGVHAKKASISKAKAGTSAMALPA